ncbi:hypothetical protein [uncultured Subdoligranulum sp.]|uniref:hypothetical protein n=1 Tax=uncultured Subdoligranulum sp. TaxID=512298 RepID=UPI0025D104C7|nr:hypothetical protein [uncultured Subdoligranulum sp.]
MNSGKAFELLVKRMLLNIGFSEVISDGLYVYDGTPGQMIQGLGEAHNADVLLEPPVQTPFYSRTRLLIECKNYKKKVGLDIIRSALGLREDINNFNLVDEKVLKARRRQRRKVFPSRFEHYYYQVAVASFEGFTTPAQEFAAAYRIPLIEFNKLPFWTDFCKKIGSPDPLATHNRSGIDSEIFDKELLDFVDKIGHQMAVAITNAGQMLFLYHNSDEGITFDNHYSLHWIDPKKPWKLKSGKEEYLFQLPTDILRNWLSESSDEITMKLHFLNRKADYMANMIVYFTDHERPSIKMISIDQSQLEEAKSFLEESAQNK